MDESEAFGGTVDDALEGNQLESAGRSGDGIKPPAGATAALLGALLSGLSSEQDGGKKRKKRFLQAAEKSQMYHQRSVH